MSKLLIVEDDEDLANNVRTFLTFERHVVECVTDGALAADMLKTFEYDLLILDWQLPGMTGIEITREYRKNGGRSPILMLTGLNAIENKEQGLDTGVDDYLTKPFDLRELGARVRALLRRPRVATSNVLTAGDLSLNQISREILKNGAAINLLPREFQLLEFMLRHPNEIFSQTTLLNRVWTAESDATEEALRSTMKRLRKKVDPEGTIIRNVHGVGFILDSNAEDQDKE